MNNQDFTTTFEVNAPASAVFDAVTNVRGWWSENIEGATNQQGSRFTYHYQDVHRATMKIAELIPGKRMVWHVEDNYFKFTRDETEWTGTHIIFELSEQDGSTRLKFTHQGLVPAYECFQICHDAWTHYIQSSLKDLITKGKGSPTPAEEKESQQSTDQATETSDNKSICHRLLIGVPVEKVFAAVTTQEGLAGWWTPDTTAKAEAGSILKFEFGPDYHKEMQVLELRAYSRVKWLCIKAFEEWIGTTITFEIEPHAKGAILIFRHSGWKAYTNEFASCSYAWALFLGSLKSLCERGAGTPYPAIG
ncbi:SRPBCC domain-containing protein [Pedobacter sp. SYP-B3415]|uniref:SRPBCC family protein n=1 Tax=Pedobacter sp. SYP-B3415 TaxID=2496641 RepID=UPI00101C0F3A|nr:SRPBCC domain-containing protein [Pedobacter sp. SYP-B3415]